MKPKITMKRTYELFIHLLNSGEIKKEPFMTIEITSKEGYEFFVEQFEKQRAKKPLGADLHGKTSENIHNWICPMCKHFLSNRRKVTEAHNNFIPSYCPVCGQKLDWSDIK